MEDVSSTPSPSFFVRRAAAIRWVCMGLAVVGLFLLMRVLPVREAIGAMEGLIERLGVWGAVVFVVVYVVATILLVPGSALTLAAGAIFGLFKGTIVVSIASTTGAAFSFLIARYLARNKVAKQVEAYPKFGAIDRAIGAGGWKIVAMLRLSPAVPFNLQNYLYGLTAIRFWPCVLTSWLAMLPGTFMYVYFGYLARQGAETAAGSQGSADLGKWALIAVGLAATVAVTVYITRLANKALKEQTNIEDKKSPEKKAENARPPWGWIVIAVALLATGVYAQVQPNAIRGPIVALFGPPKVTLSESYEVKPNGPTFDHSAFDALLGEYVDEGWVDYANLKNDTKTLDQYIESLGKAEVEDLGRDEKLAFYINAYNAFTLRLILDAHPIDSIKDIPAKKRWDAKRWDIGGQVYSLNQIEHELVRPNFKEPRIHFALVCAAIGCPILRSEAYTGATIEAQLEAQAVYVHSHDRWLKWDRENNTVYLTQLYNWYGSDFEQVAGSIQDYAARYAPALKAAIEGGASVNVKFLDYDWSLNSTEHVK